MKKILTIMLAVFLLAGTIPAFSAQMTKEEKDTCLLASRNCMNQVDTIQQKIRKLDAEIKKGNRVYSADELNRLQQKLKEAEDIIDDLTGRKSGGS